MSRAETRTSQRAAAERNRERWTYDCARAEARDADRARIASRLKELSEKLRVPAYPGRDGDLEEVDRLWAAIARSAP